MKFKRAIKHALGVGTLLDPRGDETRRTTAVIEWTADQVWVLRCGPGLPAADEPASRGVALGPLVGVLHRLDLPPADADTTAKLIEAQLETLIPGQAEHVSWGWQRASADGPVLVVTAARRRLDALLEQVAFDALPAVIGNPALALHQVFATCCDVGDRKGLAVIASQHDRCHLLTYIDGQLGSLDTINVAGAGAEGSADALAAVIKQHLDAAESERSENAAPPGNFTLIGEEPPSGERVSAFEKALASPYRRADGLLKLSGLDRITTGNLVAVGSAIAAAKPRDTINLAAAAATPSNESAYRPTRGRWIAAAALLVGALVFLYVSDTRKAERLESTVESSNVEAKDLATLNTDLAVARFLEKSGPGFLAILDEFGHRTEGFMVDELRFERDGTFTMRATARSAEEVNRLATKLADMKTLTSVRVRNQVAKDRDKIEYTLIAQPSPRFFQPFAPPPAKKSAESPAAQAGKPRGGGA